MICGKSEFDFNIQSQGPPKVERNVKIPDVVPPFRRSAALQYQINHLKSNDCDYVASGMASTEKFQH